MEYTAERGGGREWKENVVCGTKQPTLAKLTFGRCGKGGGEQRRRRGRWEGGLGKGKG